jgi:hypothetical protein
MSLLVRSSLLFLFPLSVVLATQFSMRSAKSVSMRTLSRGDRVELVLLNSEPNTNEENRIEEKNRKDLEGLR